MKQKKIESKLTKAKKKLDKAAQKVFRLESRLEKATKVDPRPKVSRTVIEAANETDRDTTAAVKKTSKLTSSTGPQPPRSNGVKATLGPEKERRDRRNRAI